MYLLSAKEVVRSWFADKEFCDNIHMDMDVSINAYRKSKDFERINRGDALHNRWPPGMLDAPDSILLGCCCDGCQAHSSSTQGHTGVAIRCLDLPPAMVSKKKFIAPVMFVDPPEPHDLDRVMQELLSELRQLALEGIAVETAYGEKKLVKAVLVEWTLDSRGGQKLEQRGGAGKKRPCSICSALAMLTMPGCAHPYIGGYHTTVPLFLPNGITDDVHIGDDGLYYSEQAYMDRGVIVDRMIREARDAPRGERLPAARLKEARTSSGINRTSLVMNELAWLSGMYNKAFIDCMTSWVSFTAINLFIYTRSLDVETLCASMTGPTAFPAAYLHTMLLGLTKQFWRGFHETYKAGAFKLLKLQDERRKFVGLPSEYNRPLKVVVPSSTMSSKDATIMSGWICEHVWHHSETFSLLISGPVFSAPDLEGDELEGVALQTLSLMPIFHHMWQRLQGATTFLLRGAMIRATQGMPPQEVEHINLKIKRGRVRYAADIRVFAILVEKFLGVKYCKYVLHIAVCRIVRHLSERGHTLNENYMEQFMGDLKGGVR